MTGRSRGFLLLTSHLGNPERRVLTMAQLRTLSRRMKGLEPDDPDRELTVADLAKLGYGPDMSRRIIALLAEEDLLLHYLRRGEKAGCIPISRISPQYPQVLMDRLGQEAPGCLWAKGDLDVLKNPCVSLVGSRDLNPRNLEFAAEAGRQAALQGYTLISGNARGADRTAQQACLEAGGRVVSIVADDLSGHDLRKNVLYLSEEDFDGAFSAQRALSRNRCIHALGEKVFVAQASCRHGGTWDGTVKNLRFHWSPVFCFADGSPASELLHQMGANPVCLEQLFDFTALQPSEENFLGR